MSWNHRLIAHIEENENENEEEVYFQIHEVYYDNDGEPEGYTKNGVSVGSDSLEGINWVLDKMKECIDKPIFLADDFPKEYKKDD